MQRPQLDTRFVFYAESVEDSLQETFNRIARFAHGPKWQQKGVIVPQSIMRTAGGITPDEFSEPSRSSKIYDLWALFEGATNTQMNKLFSITTRSPKLTD